MTLAGRIRLFETNDGLHQIPPPPGKVSAAQQLEGAPPDVFVRPPAASTPPYRLPPPSAPPRAVPNSPPARSGHAAWPHPFGPRQASCRVAAAWGRGHREGHYLCTIMRSTLYRRGRSAVETEPASLIHIRFPLRIIESPAKDFGTHVDVTRFNIHRRNKRGHTALG